MKRLSLIALFALSCATKAPDGALLARVDFAANTKSTCIQVVVRSQAGTEVRSGAIATTRTRPLKVGIARAGLPNTVTVFAVGFSDKACTVATVPAERSAEASATFAAGKTSELTLLLTTTNPPACTCDTPPACGKGPGTCVDGGCQYAADPGKSCSDSNPCTLGDACSAAGVCEGGPATCVAPSACLKATGCSQDAGCSFSAATGDACDDGNSCSTGDSCQADAGCSGASVGCVATECRVFANQCSADAGCLFDVRDAGAACDGGVCNVSGACIKSFPYPTSNFDESQLPVPSPSTKLNCAVVVDSRLGDGGVSFNGWCGLPAPAFKIIAQPGASDAVLVAFDELEVGLDASVRFQGDRPVILASTGNLRVLGELLAESGASNCTDGGSGGAVSGLKGGGGGGYGTVGGSGGNQGGAAGVVNGGPLLVPLRGGCPGGSGIRGGGALQLSAAGNLTLTGTVAAAGQGGPGGQNVNGAGRGGGSGGAILLEGLFVLVGPTASVTANGGAGGEGADLVFDGQSGANGQLRSEEAAEGGTSLNGGGRGGNGAAAKTASTNGNSSVFNAGGGGGAGVGRVRINTASTCSLAQPASLSPDPTFNLDGGCT